MDVSNFVAQIQGFHSRPQPEQIKLLGWYLHTYRGLDRFQVETIRGCYDDLHQSPANISRDLVRLAERKPPELLKDARGYRLEGRARAACDAKYGELPSSIDVAQLLVDLPSKIPTIAQRSFLREAISCYRVKAFRAAIVMAWNLSFDHLLRWILSDGQRLSTFNARISVRYPKKQVQIANDSDFEDLKESEVIEILNSAGLVPGAIVKILSKELTRRNTCAHPSDIEITQYQAEDTITDLINNVVLKLT
jgi:hypothetical protein